MNENTKRWAEGLVGVLMEGLLWGALVLGVIALAIFLRGVTYFG